MYRVDFNLAEWRYMFGPLYERVKKFALEQGQTEAAIRVLLTRMMQGSPEVLLFVELDPESPTAITAHALASLLPQPDGVYWLFVEQLEVDQAQAKGNTFVAELLAWVEQTLRLEVPVTRIVLSTTRDPRLLERRYGFQRMRTLMSKEVSS